jgi:hypothetical protein
VRELDRAGRWAAIALAAALLVAPLLAFLQLAPDWVPANDPAVMALRALDVGTARTPLLGQPSTARNQLGDAADDVLGPGADHDVYCLGPLHYYLLAPAVRLLGAATGMLVVSLLINGACLLLVAWAVFRQLGRGAGLLAVVLLGTITFTTGASSLVNPLNSMIVAYPLLCSAVLSWCLLGGDRRLLPLTVGVVSFTAQQHLSILPVLFAAFALGLVGVARPLADRVRRGAWRDDAERRELRRWGGLAAGVAVVLWIPTVLQQGAHRPGNLIQLGRYSRSDARHSIGLRAGIEQVAHVLGLPPILGQRRFDGRWLLGQVAIGTWLSAAAVVTALAVLAVVWRRPGPRRDLMAMTAVLAVAAVVNAAQVPAGVASIRTDLSHWVWPLVFFVTLSLGLGAAQLVAQVGTRPRAPRLPLLGVATAVALVAVVVPAAVNPTLDRPTNREQDVNAPIGRRPIEAAADAVVAREDELDAPIAVLVRGQASGFDGLDAALALALEERGHPARLQHPLARNVHPDRLVDRATVRTGIVLVLDGGPPVARPPGELVADIDTGSGFDTGAYEELLDAVDAADTVTPGPEMQQMLDHGPDDQERLIAYGLSRLPTQAPQMLRDPVVVQLLLDLPLVEPHFDPALLRRLLTSLASERTATRLQVYLLDRDQLLTYGTTWELGDLPTRR